MTSTLRGALATLRDHLPTIHTRHHLDEIERQAWHDGYLAACGQMLHGPGPDDLDDPLEAMVCGLHDRDLDDALAPPAGLDPDMN